MLPNLLEAGTLLGTGTDLDDAKAKCLADALCTAVVESGGGSIDNASPTPPAAG